MTQNLHLSSICNFIKFLFYILSILKGAEELGLMKPVKEKFGGGKKEFVFDDRDCYEGVEDHTSFLNSQERQNIVQNILYSLRAKDDDQIGKIKFGEGQGIGQYLFL